VAAKSDQTEPSTVVDVLSMKKKSSQNRAWGGEAIELT